MWKGLFFFLKLALLVALGVWLADRPGQATIDWLGYRVESSVALLLVVLALLIGVMALLYRAYRALVSAPKILGKARGESRRSRGYQALNHGMVALASGDARAAEKWAKKANTLLQDPPLTRLLSAQAAQLNGDEAEAARHYRAMLENDETRFLGLRGLVLQARREGDEATARRYLLEAKALRRCWRSRTGSRRRRASTPSRPTNWPPTWCPPPACWPACCRPTTSRARSPACWSGAGPSPRTPIWPRPILTSTARRSRSGATSIWPPWWRPTPTTPKPTWRWPRRP